MGEWFHAACHTCRKTYSPPLLKRRELELNGDCREWLGVFLVQHAGHIVELRGDERTRAIAYRYSGVDGYEHAELEEPDGGWHLYKPSPLSPLLPAPREAQ